MRIRLRGCELQEQAQARTETDFGDNRDQSCLSKQLSNYQLLKTSLIKSSVIRSAASSASPSPHRILLDTVYSFRCKACIYHLFNDDVNNTYYKGYIENITAELKSKWK